MDAHRFAGWKKLLVGIAVVVAAVLALLVVHFARHTMRRASEFEVNSPGAVHAKVLIATQGSAFKDSVVAGVVAHLKPHSAYVKVIDVSGLPQVQVGDWDAVVVIHTWQLGKPQPDAQTFISRAQNLRKVIVLGTSGEGTLKIDGVDAISSASEMIDVPQQVALIDARIDALLEKPSPAATATP